ncbi:MAG: DUF885 family protein [Elusimicrobiaceae bacterium]|nr:DUF885 family protein [Elusimicrobiaceae bacterium]
MNKKLMFMGFLAVGLLSFSPALQAQTGFESGNISAILEDNSLRDTFTRYTSVLTFFFPEEATRMGFTIANNTLNDRSAQTDDQALQAFRAVQSALEQINVKALSANKQAEYTLLADALNRQIFELNQNRLARDPLYYAQALDAIYDLLLTPQTNLRKQRTDLLGRVNALPKIAKQARENLTQAPPHLARLAMEKAYFAYLAFDDVAAGITQGNALTNDPRDAAAAEQSIQQAKSSVRQMFDLFKELSQPGVHVQDDVRLGDDHYYELLQAKYQITDKPQALTKQLMQELDHAQHQLFDALVPFQLSTEEEEITVVEGLNEIPQTKLDKKPAAKTAKPVYSTPTANQFYAIANQLESPFKLDQILQEFTKQAAALSSRLLQNRALSSTAPLTIRPLDRYFSYQHAYLTEPAFGVFWLRLPQGNKLAQQEMLKRDFNEPALKLLISQELVPGRYYQNQMVKNMVRRIFGSPTLANGWTLYALDTTNKQGYFVTDEERLFFAWQHYLSALSAVIDQRLHTLQYTYEEAMDFLTTQNGFTQENATALINPILAQPGQAVSFVWGANLLEKAIAPYAKKGKSQAIDLLLKVGNVSPQDLTQELKRVSKK